MMNSPICSMFDIEFPLFAFSHCRDVVAAVSKAGGMGVLGAVGMSPEQLEAELKWIDEHVDGKPYGVDLLIPNNMVGKGEELPDEQLLAMIPEAHKQFTAELLRKYDVDPSDLTDEVRMQHMAMSTNMRDSGAQRLLDVAFSHPISLIVNALGVPPDFMLQQGKANGVKVGALVGAKEHALKQVQAGVDVLIVSGTEGGGHCGNVTSMVLIPEVAMAVAESGHDTPILAAGGIVTGRQMAAAMAMGAAGAWCASVWLTTAEAETSSAVKEKMLAASSSQTVRSKSRTGKFSRQLQSAWTDAWESPDAPRPLPMPLQSVVSEPPLRKLDKLAEGGHDGARKLATYWVGQGVGMMQQAMGAGQVVQAFKEDFLNAHERLNSFLE